MISIALIYETGHLTRNEEIVHQVICERSNICYYFIFLLDIQIIEVGEASDGFTRHPFEKCGEKCCFRRGVLACES